MALMEFAVIGSALISWLVVAIALFCLLKVKRQSALTEKIIKRLTRDLQAANSSAVSMGRRLLVVEKQRQQPQPTPASSQDDEFQVYSQAAELLSSGVEADDVALRCGLSRAETSLMQLMRSHADAGDNPDMRTNPDTLVHKDAANNGVAAA